MSARWLAGTLLTGVTSTALMGIALSAALDGHQGAASPAGLALVFDPDDDADTLAKGQRVVATAMPVARSRQVLELSTVTRDGDREVIRTLPFGYVNMLLAARYPANADYPRFDPLKIFARPSAGETADESSKDDDGAQAASAGAAEPAQIYGARVESEVRLKVGPFVFDSASYERTEPLDAAQAESLVRSVEPRLGSGGPVQVASLSTVDPGRFNLTSDVTEYEPGSAFRVIEENVSLAVSDPTDDPLPRFHEEILPLREKMSVADMLARSGHEEIGHEDAVSALAELLGDDKLAAGDALRLGIETRDGKDEIVRLSAYRGDKHLGTVAATQDGPFEPAAAPEMADSVAEAFGDNQDEAPLRADMPSVYDGIYQAALSYGLNSRLCQQLVRMLASDVDLQARLSPSDRLAVFYSMEKGKEEASDASEILFAEISFGGSVKRFYRYRPTGTESADYFDADGKSAKQFLMRKPVPNARFSSGYSTGRKHPVLGYVRPHWGVDWAAPRGTPILAAGDGVVEKAGWSSGYGRETAIRHSNGYETVYGHQSAIAKGIKPGTRIRQGQVIGYVGSTGLSTGNHLHFEILVNGTHVDPMRIKLPSGIVLAGDDLAKFKRERDRIDKLLEERVESPLVADR
ncbi:M23 family metallopeptidase [Aurantimonas sp. VKM B-3413]|uniref:M23 family metallopeptidase n=1 Tax=Aurantimonas sp. VKM B-3413 TaxID=2779401 RepID=UPI00351D3C4B